MCLKQWFQRYPALGALCCCSSVLWLSLHFRVAQKSIFSSFCKFPISTAPRPELLLCKLLAHFSKKPCCRTIGFQTIWAPYARVSVAMRYLRDFFSKLLVFGDRDKFHVIFTTPNFRIFKRAARYANRAEIEPGPRDFKKRKIGLLSCRFIAVFQVFALFFGKTNCRSMDLQTLAAPIGRVSCSRTELKTVLHIEDIFCSKCRAVCKLFAFF